MVKNIFIFSLCLIVTTFSLIVDIEEDFDFEIEYRLQKLETNWNKRGKLSFMKKDPVVYKPKIFLKDFALTSEMKKQIKSECKLDGLYVLHFINNQNKNQNYYTSIKACDLVNANYHDKLVLNTLTPIKKNKINSLTYLIDEDYDEDYDDDDDDEIEKPKKSKNKELTKIEINKVKIVDGPFFTENDDGLDEVSKQKKGTKNTQPQGFLGKYWWIIAIMMFMMMMKGQDQEGQEGQGQGQQAENK